MENTLWKHILHVKKVNPLVHNITNYVVMNNSANALLAAGASPIMAHALEELEDILKISPVLVINIGTIEPRWLDRMLFAAEYAHKQAKPWILDPVGVGASKFRNEVVAKLLTFKPSVIRGNASEIMALANYQGINAKGVDSHEPSEAALQAASELAKHYNNVICISGATDYIVSKHRQAAVANGSAMMPLVTGLGCSCTAIIAAFVACIEEPFEACLAAQAYFSLCGERAARNAAGPGSLQLRILDELYALQQSDFLNEVKIKIA